MLDQKSSRVPTLDAIRGLAISGVFLFHIAPFVQNKAGLIHNLLLQGWVGVDLFFVLSGFLITSILLRTKHARGYFLNFYARRILRIFPVYYLFLAAVAATFIASPTLREQLQALYEAQGWYWAYLQNWVLAVRPGFNASFLGHFWSLAIEEQFYLFWPLIVRCFRERHLLVICWGIVIGSLALRTTLGLINPGIENFLYFSTICRMDSLAMGAIAAIVLRDGIPDRQLRAYSKLILLPSLLGLILVMVHNPIIWDNW
jgi:peptidoglycan/LPS O-acetylase OafA/YrhL